jgi:3-oxoadipate enol-lactonase
MLEQFLDVEGARLSYTLTQGAGPTIVGLHGLSSSRASQAAGGYFDWSAIRSSGRRLLQYDARGHGRSTGRAEPDDYAWPRLAEDLFALLDEVTPGEPVDAFGVSMGAGTLLHAVTAQPGRFRRLALVIPPTAYATRAAQAAGYRQMASIVESGGSATLVDAMRAAPPLPILKAGGWNAFTPPDITEALLPAVMRGAATTDLPDPDQIAAVQQPVLLSPWPDDPTHPVATAERLHELLPNSVLEMTRTPEDLRRLGERLADFFAPTLPVRP